MAEFKPGTRVRYKAGTVIGDRIAGHTGTVVENAYHPKYINVQPDSYDSPACPVDGQWHSLPDEIEEIA